MITKDKITEIFCMLRVGLARILMRKCNIIRFLPVPQRLADVVKPHLVTVRL